MSNELKPFDLIVAKFFQSADPGKTFTFDEIAAGMREMLGENFPEQLTNQMNLPRAMKRAIFYEVKQYRYAVNSPRPDTKDMQRLYIYMGVKPAMEEALSKL